MDYFIQLNDKECQIIRSNHKTTNSIDYLTCFKNRVTPCALRYKFSISVTYIILFFFSKLSTVCKIVFISTYAYAILLKLPFFLVFLLQQSDLFTSQSLFLYNNEIDQTSDMNFTSILNFHTHHNISQRLQVVG